MSGRRSGSCAAMTHSTARAQICERQQRALRAQRAERKRIGRSRELDQARHVPLRRPARTTSARRSATQSRSSLRKFPFGRELGSPIGVGRVRLGRSSVSISRADASACGAQRGHEDETPHAGALRGLREAAGRGGVQAAEILVRRAGHRRRNAGRVNDRVDAGERRRSC